MVSATSWFSAWTLAWHTCSSRPIGRGRMLPKACNGGRDLSSTGMAGRPSAAVGRLGAVRVVVIAMAPRGEDTARGAADVPDRVGRSTDVPPVGLGAQAGRLRYGAVYFPPGGSRLPAAARAPMSLR